MRACSGSAQALTSSFAGPPWAYIYREIFKVLKRNLRLVSKNSRFFLGFFSIFKGFFKNSNFQGYLRFFKVSRLSSHHGLDKENNNTTQLAK